ncbi:hypothetical protein [Phyllobacterium salinisoli]|uniref:hypothetical protein n=1 Tax=Phyllobacterium salinisoli TaxID=1899321 RepID=UPI00135A6339|nr:hypothetical protein [Phyllobacterium salinisoli]
MPNQVIPRGHTANLGTNTVTNNLNVVGVATPYTISINGGATVAHVAAIGVADVYPINGQSVSVTNTTATPGPDNLTISW